MKKYINLLMVFLCASLHSSAQQNDENNTASINTKVNIDKICADCCRKDGDVPLGVMTAHIHSKNEWMVSYVYMNMAMRGNKMGTSSASDDAVYRDYMMSPEKMNMQMHMAMLMYGITDRLTVMAMGGYAIYNMSMNMDQAGMNMMMNMPGMPATSGIPMASNMSSKSSGITDTKLYAMYSVSDIRKHNLIGSLGVNLPTGSTTANGMTLISENGRLAYPMQIGTGSYSVLPNATYLHKGTIISWGAQAGADIKLNDNAEGYRVGNVYNGTAWISYRFLPNLSASLRGEHVITDKISGYDPEIAVLRNNDPNANGSNFGGQRTSLYIGVNYSLNSTALKNLHILAEYGMPVYENLNGVQMSQRSSLLAGLQYMF